MNLEKAKEVQNYSQGLIIPWNEKTGFLNLPFQGYINMKHLIIREMKLVHADWSLSWTGKLDKIII